MIINKTKNIIVSEKEINCKNIFSQMIGLMFHRKQNLIMYFNKQRKISLHNFFVFYPLEIVILDEDMKVIEIFEEFKPFTFLNSSKKGKFLLELGLDDSKGKINLSDKLVIN